MNILHDISPERIKPEKFDCVIEISKESKNKYELDKETGMLKLDRILSTSTHYTTNYGFIPLTHWDDGDPLDVFVFCSQPIQPMCLVNCKAIGAVDMVDNNEKDTKIIAVMNGDPIYNNYNELEDLPPHIMDELSHFLKIYKELEGKKTIVDEFRDKMFAMQCIEESLVKYKKKYKIKT